MKVSKMMVFRVLKWLALALGILMLSLGMVGVEATAEKATAFTAATMFVLFAIFFHLEQHKS